MRSLLKKLQWATVAKNVTTLLTMKLFCKNMWQKGNQTKSTIVTSVSRDCAQEVLSGLIGYGDTKNNIDHISRLVVLRNFNSSVLIQENSSETMM